MATAAGLAGFAPVFGDDPRKKSTGAERPSGRMQVLVEQKLEELRRTHHLPAMTCGIVWGDSIAVAAVGYRKYGSTVPVTTGDRFAIASCTKSMTATMMARLAEAGLFSWKTNLSDCFPDLRRTMQREYRKVTLHQLLCQISGFGKDSEYHAWRKLSVDLFKTPGGPRVRQQFADIVTRSPPTSEPGSKFEYTGTNYILATAFVEKLTGLSYNDLMHKYLFLPFRMKHAGTGGYGAPERLDQPMLHRWHNHRWVPFYMKAENPGVPAGGVSCSIRNFLVYAKHHLAGERGHSFFLGSETYRFLHTPPPVQHYAMGWFSRRMDRSHLRRLNHTGSHGFDFAIIDIDAPRNMAVVAQANAAHGADKACEQMVKYCKSLD